MSTGHVIIFRIECTWPFGYIRQGPDCLNIVGNGSYEQELAEMPKEIGRAMRVVVVVSRMQPSSIGLERREKVDFD